MRTRKANLTRFFAVLPLAIAVAAHAQAVDPRRPRDLEGDTLVGERGRPGRRDCAISYLVGPELHRQADGLLPLPQSMDRRTSCPFCFATASGVAILLAGTLGWRLSARTYET
jgi:hypothetical protein